MRNNVHSAVWIAPAVMLVLAVLPLPYGYYTALRIVVCGAAGFLVYQLSGENGDFSFWLFGFFGIAVLFNPIIPIHLTKAIWQPIDLGAAGYFVAHWWWSCSQSR